MADTSLLDFFHAKKEKNGNQIDWQAKKERWLERIENLYVTILNDYLAPAIQAGDVSYTYRPKQLEESYIGPYVVRELVLFVGDESVIFSPKGCNIVGSSGRIDLLGEMDKKTLILNADKNWMILAYRTPVVKVLPLDQQTLLDVLKEIMRP